MTGTIPTTTLAATLAAGLGVPAVWLVSFLAGGLGSPGLRVDPTVVGAGRAVPPAAGFEQAWILNGPDSGDVGDDMVIDDSGNIFVAGYHGGLDIDRDGTIEVPADEIDPLFLKIGRTSRDGWARGLRAPGFTTATGVAPDGQGGAFGVGSFERILDAGSALPPLAGNGGLDGFLVRYDSDGSVMWMRGVGGAGRDGLAGVASDAAGNAYVVGTGEGLPDPAAAGRPGPGPAAWLLSYDRSGNLRWATAATGAAGSATAGIVELAPSGDLVVVGTTDGDLDVDGDGSPELVVGDGRFGFVARFDIGGRFLGGRPLPGPDEFAARGVAFAADGDMLLAGSLRGSADLDGDGVADLRGPARRAGAVVRFDVSGALAWARVYETDGAWDVATDGDRIAVSGFYRGARDIDGDGRPEPHDPDTERTSEIAVLILSDNGAIEDVWTAVGPGNDQARAAVFLHEGPIVYVTGFVQLTADFSGDGVNDEGWVRCDALGDIFVARYDLSLPSR